MQLYIPPLGSLLKLSTDWTFILHPEYRNKTLFEFLGMKKQPTFEGSVNPIDDWRWDETMEKRVPVVEESEREKWLPKQVTLPKGIVLQIDRIYIRKGQDDFDSITFTVPDKKVAMPEKVWTRGEFTERSKNRMVRFWVHLDQANLIHFEHVEAA